MFVLEQEGDPAVGPAAPRVGAGGRCAWENPLPLFGPLTETSAPLLMPVLTPCVWVFSTSGNCGSTEPFQLTELRKMGPLLDYWFLIKGHNSGTSTWKRCPGQGVGPGAQRSHALGVHPSPPPPLARQPTSSPNSSFWGFMEALLCM